MAIEPQTGRSAPPASQRWRVWDIAAILAMAMLVLPALGESILELLWEAPGPPADARLLAGMLIQETSLGALAALSVTAGYGAPLERIGWHRRGLPVQVALGLAVAALLVFINVAGDQLSTLLLGLFLPQTDIARLLALENRMTGLIFTASSGPRLLAAVVLVDLLAPVAEEIFFRGFAITVLAQNYGHQRAIWGSALLFAAVHLYVIHFLPIFIIGLVLAWLFWRTRSLAACITAHAALNLAVSVLLIRGL